MVSKNQNLVKLSILRGKNHLVMSKIYLYFLSGIAAVVRVDIENALKDDEWSSTDLMQFLKDKYENEAQKMDNANTPSTTDESLSDGKQMDAEEWGVFNL